MGKTSMRILTLIFCKKFDIFHPSFELSFYEIDREFATPIELNQYADNTRQSLISL